MVIRVVPVRAEDRDMRTNEQRSVKVSREKLLARLKENRAKHEKEFSELFFAYKTRVVQMMTIHVKYLEGKLSGIEDLARDELLAFDTPKYQLVPRPEDHTIDYDRAIDRIEWEEDEVVSISEDDFNCYVRDEWNWRQRFRQTSRAITG